jgi:hypothetical protein
MFIISDVPERGSPDTTITEVDGDVDTGIASITWRAFRERL